MPWFTKPYADFVQRLRVPIGFLLAAAFAYWSSPTEASIEWGAPISIAGLLLRGWAAGHLAKNESLAVSGPYALTRNPLYLGTLLVALGLVHKTHALRVQLLHQQRSEKARIVIRNEHSRSRVGRCARTPEGDAEEIDEHQRHDEQPLQEPSWIR